MARPDTNPALRPFFQKLRRSLDEDRAAQDASFAKHRNGAHAASPAQPMPARVIAPPPALTPAQQLLASLKSEFPGPAHAVFREDCMLDGLTMEQARERKREHDRIAALPKQDFFTKQWGPVPNPSNFAAAFAAYISCGVKRGDAYRLVQIHHAELWQAEKVRLANEYAAHRQRRSARL